MNDNSFGKWLKDWRKKHDLSTRHMATLLEVSQTYIWKLENEKVGPSIRFLRKFSGIFEHPEVYIAAGRLIPEKELKKIRNTPTIIDDKTLEYLKSERTMSHPVANLPYDPDLTKFMLDVYWKIKSMQFTKQDLDFIIKIINSYFDTKQKG